MLIVGTDSHMVKKLSDGSICTLDIHSLKKQPIIELNSKEELKNSHTKIINIIMPIFFHCKLLKINSINHS